MLHRKLSWFLAVCCSFLLTNCTNLSNPARSHALDSRGTYWFDYAADRRGSIMVAAPVTDGRPSGVMICAEPAPDVAQNFVNSLKAQGGYQGASAQVQADLNSTIVQLAGRTQVILFMREAMYRICEENLDGNLTNQQVFELYKSVINASVQLVQAQYLAASADNIKAATAASTLLPKDKQGTFLENYSAAHPSGGSAKVTP